MAETLDYAHLASCTLHLRRVDPERLSNAEQISQQQARLRQLCQLMDLEPVDINVKRSLKRKGQAFITFNSPAETAKARELLHGFQMVKGGRNIEAEVARTPADVLVERHCTERELEEHVKRRKADKDRKRALETPVAAPAPAAAPKRPGDTTTTTRPSKTAKLQNKSVIPDEYLPPNNILFVRDVPDDYSTEMLEALFSRYPGFREVRTIPVPAYKGCAFVEYEANEGAIQAREALNGRVLGDAEKGLRVTYQKAG